MDASVQADGGITSFDQVTGRWKGWFGPVSTVFDVGSDGNCKMKAGRTGYSGDCKLKNGQLIFEIKAIYAQLTLAGGKEKASWRAPMATFRSQRNRAA